jgi:hypothetical protein
LRSFTTGIDVHIIGVCAHTTLTIIRHEYVRSLAAIGCPFVCLRAGVCGRQPHCDGKREHTYNGRQHRPHCIAHCVWICAPVVCACVCIGAGLGLRVCVGVCVPVRAAALISQRQVRNKVESCRLQAYTHQQTVYNAYSHSHTHTNHMHMFRSHRSLFIFIGAWRNESIRKS